MVLGRGHARRREVERKEEEGEEGEGACVTIRKKGKKIAGPLSGSHSEFRMLARLSSRSRLLVASSRLLLLDMPSTSAAACTAAAPLKRKARGTSTAAAKKASESSSIPTSSTPLSPPPLKKKKPYSLPTSPNAGSPSLLSKAEKISAQLAALYPDPPCPLTHANRTQLLVAVMLSAQTTDLKVNEATKTLFAEAPTAVELASLGAEGIEAHIKSLGLAPTKARNVAATASILVERYGRTGKEDGDLPLDVSREELESLPGVGRKTASVVLAMSGLVQALPVDTHIHRLSQRWGFSRAGASVLQVEADLCAAFGQNDGIRGQWDKLHLRLIYFGREHCPAQRHARAECPICSWAGV